MNPDLVLDEATGDFLKMILETRPTREQSAEILRKARKILNRNSPTGKELLNRMRCLLSIESKWQARKEEDRILAEAWGSNVN